MKTKFMLSLVAAAVVSSPVMALQVVKGKVISHKEWSTSGVSASYLPPIAAKQGLSHGASYLSIGVRPQQVAVGEKATVVNDSALYLTNSSGKTHSYYIVNSICVLLDLNNEECVYSKDIVELEAGGMLYSTKRPALTVALQNPGVYPTIAMGYFNDTSNDRASFTQSYGTLTVN